MSLASRALGLVGSRAQRWSFAHASRRGRTLGRWGYRLDSRHRRVALGNLAACFPDRDDTWHRHTARASFEQAGRTVVEMLSSPRLVHKGLERAVDPVGVTNIHRALEGGRGAILAGAHYGNWELMGLVLPEIGVPLVSVARPLDDPDLERTLHRLRTATGAEILPKANAIRGILRALRDGKLVALLVDQNTLRHEAVFVRFFGRLAATTPALGHLHLRSRAPILPAFAVPDGERYRLLIEEPLVIPGGPRDEVIEQVTARATERIEHHVRACPEAWLWMHDRWRERPAE